MRVRQSVVAGIAASAPPLLELGKLEQGLVVSRPSKTIKSPYVADVLLVKDVEPSRRGELQERLTQLRSSRPAAALGTAKVSKAESKRATLEQQNLIFAYLDSLTSTRHLAHAPSLDCAGMAVSGAAVWLSERGSDSAKTAFTIQLCEEDREEEGERAIVGYHPVLAEKAFRALLDADDSFVQEQLGVEGGRASIESVLSQQTFGKSRVDFVLPTRDNRLLLVEVKNVVGADYIQGRVPLSRSPVGVYTVPPTGALPRRCAIFPHGSNTKADLGVVSDRAIKHLTELQNLQGSIHADGRRIQSVVMFMVNRNDCTAFRPCHEADMVFAQCLQAAEKAGVLVLAKALHWDLQKGCCTAGKYLPVVYDDSVDYKRLDPELLARVLAYNEIHGSDRSGSPSKSESKSKSEIEIESKSESKSKKRQKTK